MGSRFSAIFFAFLPFILLSAGMSIVLTWRISSAILGLVMAVVAVIDADWPFLVGVLGSLGLATAQFIRLLMKLAS